MSLLDKAFYSLLNGKKTITSPIFMKEFSKENQQLTDLEDLTKKITEFQYPSLLKARRDAYDGRGNFRIGDQSQIETGYQLFLGRPTMIEKFVDFKMEVSVIAARNIHSHQITQGNTKLKYLQKTN